MRHSRVSPLTTLSLLAGTLWAPAGVHAQQRDLGRLDVTEPVTYFIAQGTNESGFGEGDRRLAEWALEAWARQVDPALELVPGQEATATIRVYWVPAGAGLYGEMRRRIVNGQPAADIYVRPDTEGLGSDVAVIARSDPLFRAAVVYLTCVHELGHAFGLPHTSDFADIMYSFQYGGDFVAYFMRFRDQLQVWEDIEHTSPFSGADTSAFRLLYP